MTTTTRLCVPVLSVIAALAIPSFAQANVGDQLARASGALEGAIVAARHGDTAGFELRSRTNQRATARAQREARGSRTRQQRAVRLRRVATQHDRNLAAYAGAITDAPAELQLPLVDALAISAEARQQVIDILLGLAESLPEPARTQLIDAIARFQDGGEVELLLGALASDEVIAAVKDLISEQIGLIGEHIQGVLDQLGALAGMLPPEAGAAVEQAITLIEDNITQLTELLQSLLGSFDAVGDIGGGLGGGFVCDLLGSFPLPILNCE